MSTRTCNTYQEDTVHIFLDTGGEGGLTTNARPNPIPTIRRIPPDFPADARCRPPHILRKWGGGSALVRAHTQRGGGSVHTN